MDSLGRLVSGNVLRKIYHCLVWFRGACACALCVVCVGKCVFGFERSGQIKIWAISQLEEAG